MICMGSDKAKAAQLLDQLNAAGVRNVLTLRGDRTPTRPESPDFAHASDLAQFVWQTQPEFDIHAACYPEATPKPLPWPRMLPTCALSRMPVPPTC